MFAVLKNRALSALFLAWVLAPLPDASPAGAPPIRASSPPSQHRAAYLREAPRPLSRREIFQTIQNHLQQKGIAARGNLQPGDLIIQSAVPVIQNDAGLEVKKIAFDLLRRETVFELWTSHQPQYLPFEVATRRDPQSWGLALEPEGSSRDKLKNYNSENSAIGPGANTIRPKPPVLAKPGRPATLLMLRRDMRITTTVVPLQPGIKGQRILVRDATTARVLNAEVIDEGLLQTGF